jgi:hypothetical protein
MAMTLATRALCTLAALAALAPAARAESLTLVHSATLYADIKDEKLKAPEGVACSDNHVVVADTGNGRLLTLTFRNGGFSGAIELKAPQLGRPSRVQIDAKGDVLSLDRRGRRIARFGAGGEFKGYFEVKGAPEHEVVPAAFRVDKDGGMVLLDLPSARVVVADASGAFVRQLPLPKGSFVDVAVSAQGQIFAVDAAGGVVYAAEKGAKEMTPFAKVREYASFPSYLATTERGQVLVVDSHGNGIVVLGPDGSFLGRQLGIGWNEGGLYYPAQMCMNAQGDAFIADRNNNRVQAFISAK